MQQHHVPAELVAIEAALAVRRDIQAVATPAELSPAIVSARSALRDLRCAQLGDGPAEIYERVIRVAAAAEAVAIHIRISHPDLEIAA